MFKLFKRKKKNDCELPIEPVDTVLKRWETQAKMGMFALYELGLLYRKYSFGKEKIFKHFKLAADQGHAKACYEVAMCYESGEGTPVNLEKSFYYYHRSATIWFGEMITDASFKIGNCYMLGLGVDKSLESAVFWYKKGYEVKNPAATFNLAVCYQKGLGVSKSNQKAFILFKEAADMGYHAIDVIQDHIDQINQELNDVKNQIDEQQKKIEETEKKIEELKKQKVE